MLIDWFTVIAQAINFVLLLVVLRALLYKRVLKVIEARQDRLSKEWESAVKEREEAEREVALHQKNQRELEKQRSLFLTKAEEEANEVKQQLLHKARAETNQKQLQWKKEIREQENHFLKKLREQAGRGICQIARRALADLADTELEQRLLQVFLSHIKNIGEELLPFEQAVSSGGTIHIYSAWSFDETDRAKLRRALKRYFPPNVEFFTDPLLLCGIELRVSGHALGWSLASYLDDFSAQVLQLLEEESSWVEENVTTEKGEKTIATQAQPA